MINTRKNNAIIILEHSILLQTSTLLSAGVVLSKRN